MNPRSLIHSLIVMSLLCGVTLADNAGLADLEKARKLQRMAKQPTELGQIVERSEAALAKGLDQRDSGAAKKMIIFSLWCRASQFAGLILDRDLTGQWQEIREQAMTDLEKLLQYHPGFGPGHLLVARLQSLPGGDRERAMQAADKAVELHRLRPDKTEVIVPLLVRASLDESLVDLNEVLKIQPGHHGARFFRARRFYDRKEYQPARSDLEIILRSRPDFKKAIVLKSIIEAEEQNYSQATADIEEVLQSDPENIPFLLQLAAYLQADNQPGRVIDALTLVLKQDENHLYALQTRGDAYLSVGKQAEAVRDYERALQFDPDNLAILNDLAWLLATSPRHEVRDGERCLELAMRASKLTKFQDATVLGTLAAAFAETGNYTMAKKWAAQALAQGDNESKEKLDQFRRQLSRYDLMQPYREQESYPGITAKQP